MKEFEISKQHEYLVQVDDFRLTQDKVYRELDNIILDYIKTHKDKLTAQEKRLFQDVDISRERHSNGLKNDDDIVQ